MAAKKKKTPNQLRAEVKRLLAKVRDEGYTYEQIGEEVGASMSTIQNWHKGFTQPQQARLPGLLRDLRRLLK